MRDVHTTPEHAAAMRSAGLTIALYRPEIPPNTGNIGRLCVGTGSDLWLIGKCGFRIDDREVKRAGLDYWEKVSLREFIDLDAFLSAASGRRVIAVSKFGHTLYSKKAYARGDILLFGGETRGLPDEVWEQVAADSVFIPMTGEIRSLNLSNSAAIVLYDALRSICG